MAFQVFSYENLAVSEKMPTFATDLINQGQVP